MPSFDFDSVVRILVSSDTRGLGVAGKFGVVVGHSGGQEGDTFAVLVDDETYMIREFDLESTGEVLERGAIYRGESLGVPAEPYVQEPGRDLDG